MGGKIRRFAISSGIGFDASICHEALSSRIKNVLNRLHLGKLTYMAIALRQLFVFREFGMEIVMEDRRKVTFERVLFAAAMNMQCEGGGVKFCSDAVCNDGTLDWLIVEGASPLEAACAVSTWLLPESIQGSVRYISAGRKR